KNLSHHQIAAVWVCRCTGGSDRRLFLLRPFTQEVPEVATFCYHFFIILRIAVLGQLLKLFALYLCIQPFFPVSVAALVIAITTINKAGIPAVPFALGQQEGTLCFLLVGLCMLQCCLIILLCFGIV